MDSVEGAVRALRELEVGDLPHDPGLLGGLGDAAAAGDALRMLRETLGQAGIEGALDATRARIGAAWPEGSTGRRAALIALLAARGEARRHTRVGFDRASLLALLDSRAAAAVPPTLITKGSVGRPEWPN